MFLELLNKTSVSDNFIKYSHLLLKRMLTVGSGANKHINKQTGECPHIII
jgi:hypothetical protein